MRGLRVGVEGVEDEEDGEGNKSKSPGKIWDIGRAEKTNAAMVGGGYIGGYESVLSDPL